LLSFLATEIAAEPTFFWIVPKRPFLLNTKSMNDHITRKVFVVHLSEAHKYSANGGIIERLSAVSEVMGWEHGICSPYLEPLEGSRHIGLGILSKWSGGTR
jgi:hypothetical protein